MYFFEEINCSECGDETNAYCRSDEVIRGGKIYCKKCAEFEETEQEEYLNDKDCEQPENQKA